MSDIGDDQGRTFLPTFSLSLSFHSRYMYERCVHTNRESQMVPIPTNKSFRISYRPPYFVLFFFFCTSKYSIVSNPEHLKVTIFMYRIHVP